MKKKNNKGFTLIELLAVVVILLAISVIAVSSISAAMERNKAKQNDAKKEIIISYAKLYYEENRNSLDRLISSNGYVCVDLYTDLDLSDSERKDADGENFTGYVKVSSNGNVFEYVEQCP